MIRFEYFEPTSLEEAMALLERYGEESKILAGGTDLLPRMKQRLLRPKYLINLKRVLGLGGISYQEGKGLRMGPLVTIRSLEKSELIRDHYRPLWEAVCLLGSVQVRNLATLGGNLCHAAPSAETAAPLLALDARACIAGPGGERTIPLKDFFLGPGKTILQRGEILKEILVPPLAPRTGANYYKLSTRRAMDIATVGVAAVVTLKDGICQNCCIALGAVAPTPIRAFKAEGLLTGKRLEPSLLEEVGQQAMKEAQPITDHRASAEYRRDMVKALTIRTLQEAARRANKFNEFLNPKH